MKLKTACTLLVLYFYTLCYPCFVFGQTEKEANEVARRAGEVLNNFCFRCHRGEGSSAGGYAFNSRNVESMLDDGVVTPKSLEQSDIYHAMFRGRMPPRNQAGLPRPSAEDIEKVKLWIEQGAAPFPAIQRREFIPLIDVMTSIFEHFRKLEPQQRSQYRYFTLTNLWNDGDIDERHLRMARAALAKALNSLSWKSDLMAPEAIDTNQTVYAVNISKLGWSNEHWNAIVAEYPYHIESDAIVDGGNGDVGERLRRIDQGLIELSGNDRQIKHLRVDWFVTIGLRPKLYHKLLYDLTLPELQKRPDSEVDAANPRSMKDIDLERHLKIDVATNIFRSPAKARRAGFVESGISGQNRMIERHEIPSGGYYWKSYDFLKSNSRSILTEFPLGPRLDDDDEFSFEHDGGEIIFSLPNGLQGYLLTVARGNRLDAGPIEIVGDALKTSGNQLIVNGLSCVVCHRKGMVEPPDDVVRESAGAFGEFADKVRALYPETGEMQKVIASDSELFIGTVSNLVKPYLLEEDYNAVGDGFPVEPVGEVARWYLLQPMTLETVASELYHRNLETLRILVKSDPRARQLGIGQLRKDNGTIKREAWHSIEGRSLMQQAADVLGYAPNE